MPEEAVTQRDTSSFFFPNRCNQQSKLDLASTNQSQRYVLLSKNKFLCDETSSISRNGEVKP